MNLRVLAAPLAALSLAACATVTSGTTPLPLDRELAASSHVDLVVMSSSWLRVEEDFSDTFTEALQENLRDCATGPRKLTLRVHVHDVHREERVAAAVAGGEHEIRGVAEFVDPVSKAVVGRYPLHLAVDAGRSWEALLSDRQLMVSDAFATELCRQAFGRG